MLLGDDRLPPNFWSKIRVDDESGCWVWVGSKTVAGYGHFGRRFRRYDTGEYVHRIVVGLREELVPGMVVDHLCRNPSCCNPEHLEQVTPGENVRRGNAVGRRPVCPNDHVRTDDNTAIRSTKRGSVTVCLVCERARGRRYKSKQAA